MNKNDRKSVSDILRLATFILLLVLFFLIYIITLVNYQIVNVDKYIKLAENNNNTTQVVPAARGDIVDRNGKKLATSVLSLNLIIDREFPIAEPNDNKEAAALKDKEGNNILLKLISMMYEKGISWDDDFPISRTQPYEFLDDKKAEGNKLRSALFQQSYAKAEDTIYLLAQKYNIVGYDEQQTRDIASIRGQMLVKDFSYSGTFTLAVNISSDFAGQIMEMKHYLKGVEVSETATRHYLSGDVAPHIIGTVGAIYAEDAKEYISKGYAMDAIVGKSGIESVFEDQLKSQSGILTIERDKDGNVKNKYYEEGDEPKPGNTVRLSIDYEFQKNLQESLASFTQTHVGPAGSSKGAGLVVLDVSTGETLAIVNYPSYDINSYYSEYDQLTSSRLNPIKNRALVELYRPGSTFKTFMSASGMLSGIFQPTTYYKCVNPFPGTNMTCLQSHHRGPTNVYTALEYSCNNFFYNVAKNMGIDKIDEYAPYFGFATDSGLEVLNSDGRVTNPTYYEKHGIQYLVGYTYQTGIGQAEVYVTPLQMAISQMTIANKGTRYAAHVVKSIEKFDGSEIINKTEPQVLSELPKNSNAWKVTIDGMKLMADTRPVLAGKDIATKSGSPQYTDSNLNLTNAAAVGIYPASKPEIAMGLMIEDGASAQDFFAQIVSIYNSLKQSRLN